MAIRRCATLVLSPASPIRSSWRCCKAVMCLTLVYPLLMTTDSLMGATQPRTLQSFGIHADKGQVSRPLPSNVALGLFNPDPLPDVAYSADGKVQIFQNMGNGLFEFVGGQNGAGEVATMEWRKERMFGPNIPDQFSWGDLHIIYKDGRSEVLSHEQFIPSQVRLRFAAQPPMPPTLDFREAWRSQTQTQPSTYMALADADTDGRVEIAYCFFPQFGDSNHFVVYKCVGNDSFVVDWDTVLIGGFGPLGVTDIDGNGQKEWVIVTNGVAFLEAKGNGRYGYYSSNLQFSGNGYITMALQTDIDHNGRREVCVQQTDPSPPPGGYATSIEIGEFVRKTPGPSIGTILLTPTTARCYGYTFEMAVGQVDGTGRDEIIPAGGSFGVNEPVPINYLWYNGTTWITRSFYTGLQSGTTAPMFVNLDADTAQELFIGGVGPIGHGSCYALKYMSDTTWYVLWADSSLRNTPLSVNAGFLAGEFVVAGANTWDRSPLDTLYTQLHVYRPSGANMGIWRRDSASVQNFRLLDIDNDGRTNLVAALLSPYQHHVADYEYYGTDHVPEYPHANTFELLQNFPNPFNPRTTISFTVPRSGHVRLAVYNLLGQEVKVLVNEEKSPGKYEVEWQAIESAGGVYFYRLITESATITRKMILLR